MARTVAGDMLTEANRTLTQRYSDAFRTEVRSVTQRMLVNEPERWAGEVVGISQRYSDRMTEQARAYHMLHRTAEGATRAVTLPERRGFPERKAKSTAYAQGIAQARAAGVYSALKETPPGTVVAISKSVSSNLLIATLQESRQFSREFVAKDPEARGYARVGEGGECGFCAMLISRGAVYTKETVDFESHPNCRCTTEAVYSDWQPSPSAAAVQETVAERAGEAVEEISEKEPGGFGLGEVTSVRSAVQLIETAASKSAPETRMLDLGLSMGSMSSVDTAHLARYVDAKVIRQEGILDTPHLKSLQSGLETNVLRELAVRAGKSKAEAAIARRTTLQILAGRAM